MPQKPPPPLVPRLALPPLTRAERALGYATAYVLALLVAAMVGCLEWFTMRDPLVLLLSGVVAGYSAACVAQNVLDLMER